MDVSVVKVGGLKEPFSEEKLRQSVRRAGIPLKIHDEVVDHIKSRLHDDISTEEIYGHILEFLGKSPYPFGAARYSLKKAVMDLGPTGFPFEKYVASILSRQGYKVDTNARSEEHTSE